MRRLWREIRKAVAAFFTITVYVDDHVPGTEVRSTRRLYEGDGKVRRRLRLVPRRKLSPQEQLKRLREVEDWVQVSVPEAFFVDRKTGRCYNPFQMLNYVQFGQDVCSERLSKMWRERMLEQKEGAQA